MEDEPVRSLSLRESEINALKKAILFLKFDCDDAGADIYASSPLINAALKALIEASHWKERDEKFYAKGSKHYERYVLARIGQDEARRGGKYRDEMKTDAYEMWMYPFHIDRED